MPALPTGTVTFLFTDLEGSTVLWEQYPQATRHALVRHDALVEQIVAEHEGHVVRPRGEGDSRFAVFSRATDAISAAAALQQAFYSESWPTPLPLRVRMALHTGEADLRAGDYYGTAVNRCARLRAVAHGDQVLLSQATYALVCDHALPGVDFRDLGAHLLKDLQRPEHIFQLVTPDLPADFPPLHTLDSRPTNLPVQPTPFIGREREVAAVRDWLLRPEVRLLTLTGPGGTGKTRLALQVAADVLEAFPDGVFFVDLAPISDPDLVTTTIAATLGVKELGRQPLQETLTASLRQKEMLLLLDNFEQVLEAAPLLAALLSAAPGLKVLVTSRAVLHLAAEHEVPVPPLEVPDPRHLPALAQLSQYAAVTLFIQRAQAVKPDFQVTNANAPAVAEICVRLDGLPLAIELAAARVKLLPPQALLGRLTQRLQVLTGGARDLPARQQTLRAAIDWSFQLLAPAEQTLFRRLGVFVGGWTVKAAEAICNAVGDLSLDILDGMQSLLDKSLLRQEEGLDGEPRFSMLETIREYASECLIQPGEGEPLRRQHALYYLAVAEAAEPELYGPEQRVWFERLAAEHDNLRAVLQWLRDHQEAELGLRLGGALGWFWNMRGHQTEGRAWLADFIPLADQQNVSAAVRANALSAAATLAREQADYPAARALFEVALALQQELGDEQGLATALLNVALLARDQGDHARALVLSEEALSQFRALGHTLGIARSLYNLGWVAWFLGDYPRARTRFEECLALYEKLGNQHGRAIARVGLAVVAREQGDYPRARILLEESLTFFQQTDNRWFVAFCLGHLGQVVLYEGDPVRAGTVLAESLGLWRELQVTSGIAHVLGSCGLVAQYQQDYARAIALTEESLALCRGLEQAWAVTRALTQLGELLLCQGDDARAQALLKESLSQAWERGDKWAIARGLAGLASVWGSEGHQRAETQHAARLFGAAAAVREAIAAAWDPTARATYERHVAAIRVQLDEPAFATAWEEGQAITLEQAIAYALEEATDPT